MNKNDLVAAVAESTELKKSDCQAAVDATLAAITDALKAGDEVRLVGFGNFSVTTRKATEGRNPRTGERMKISESKQVKFRAGKALKDSIG